MAKVFVIILSILFFSTAYSQEGKVVIIEIDSDVIKVDGNVVNNLLTSLVALQNCNSVHLLADRNMNHGKLAEILQIIKKSGCENISIQSV
ncbi:hypothetical protein J7384_18860 [Endozoicomonas sp. G2_1]|uniref:biopolymer transporter ExbD n=1 Tax=Endozoicomonas sp. G2_1 TaxID=2821091 RepID=UPI001ADA3552|nr:hypothetical protein [Endozoicomonas sp. G2_1]MBO9492430.1 hypothetical protein [Endozoicomonas sp. G2_1]